MLSTPAEPSRTLAVFIEPGTDPDTHRAQVLGPIRMVEAVRLRGTIRTTAAAVGRGVYVLFGTTGFHFALARLAEHPRRAAFGVVLFGPTLNRLAGLPERLYGVGWGTALLDRDGRLRRHGSLSEVLLELERMLAATDR